MEMHSSITVDRLVEAEENKGLSNPGICCSCGEDQDGCEPDARNYECEGCGEFKVFGVQELIFHVVA